MYFKSFASLCFKLFSFFKIAPSGKDGKNYLYETVFNGMDVVGVFTFYQCHVPSSVRLSINIPSLNFEWKSENFTSDIDKSGKKSMYFASTFLSNSHASVFYSVMRMDIISVFFIIVYMFMYL